LVKGAAQRKKRKEDDFLGGGQLRQRSSYFGGRSFDAASEKGETSRKYPLEKRRRTSSGCATAEEKVNRGKKGQ